AYTNQGFERFVAEDDFDFDEEIGFGITDKDFFNQSLSYIKKIDEKDENPFFAFLVTLTSHNPYKMPEEYQKINIMEEHKNTLTADYIQAIHYTDEAIGEFIQSLKDNGLYEDSVIVIYGDHFAINAGLETEDEILNYLLGKPYDYDIMMNIPLIVHIPNEDLGETVTIVGSQLDFYPTIANIMGFKNTKGIVFGMDLNNPSRENYVFPQTYLYKGSVITKDYIFEFSRDGVY
ncbi:LTA synthase family protein, partial [Vibrio parahaemolyticus]|nr:LTA synthase family protein [Vibrio parahaemolyticus]